MLGIRAPAKRRARPQARGQGVGGRLGRRGRWGQVGKKEEGPGRLRAQRFVNHAGGMMDQVHATLGIRAPAKRRARPQGARAGDGGVLG
jgi:hypothetical protein